MDLNFLNYWVELFQEKFCEDQLVSDLQQFNENVCKKYFCNGGRRRKRASARFLQIFHKSNRRAMQAFHNFVNSQHCMAKF